jgi:hypothetical protein
MSGGYLIAVLLIGAGLAGLALAELVDRRNGDRQEIQSDANPRVSWRSLQALNEAHRGDTDDTQRVSQ